ncbi:hypothetical protein D5086_019163 [Populus alba]|uniref:Uncharacterized protein n=1 Tax=Populus alba TaxID=43335 RepID=A0ACC4BHX7_POPAL
MCSSATNRLITSKDHASVQINAGPLDEYMAFIPVHFSTILPSVVFVRAQTSTIFHPQGGEANQLTLESSTIASIPVFKLSSRECSDQDELLALRLGILRIACLEEVGIGALLEPGKGLPFSYGPFVEYKGTIPQNELQSKQHELELAANALISRGGFCCMSVLPSKKLLNYVVVVLPDYIPKDSTPRVVKLGNSAVCCGGTHVSDISEIISLQVSQIRKKKGVTKVSYTVGS